MTITAVRIHPEDNVICLLANHQEGEEPVLAGMKGPALTAPVPMGHKIALSDIAKGEPVIKYGAVIGHATQAIAPGDHVHLHNLVGAPP